MKVWQLKSLALAVLAATMLATACVPPGGKLNERALAATGKETQQNWKVPEGVKRCDVDAPDVDFRDATFGFSQTENNNPWRIAETVSMRQEADKRNVELIITDAQSSTIKQVSDIRDMVAQGTDYLFVAPREEQGLEPALEAARDAGVPIVFLDRRADAVLCQEYIAFIGSDFVAQGKRAAEWLVEATDGRAKIAELQGSLGASVTADRGEGFNSVIEKHRQMEVVASQTGDFTRAGGQAVMEQLLGAYSDINAVYAHNDEMAIGATQAIEDAGLEPGKDVTVVSVDGTKDALQAIIDGELGATVETNPRFGPVAFDTAEEYFAGERVPANTVIEDRLFDKSNAKQFIDSAY